MSGVNKAFLTVGGVFWGTQGRHAVRNLAGSGDERRGAASLRSLTHETGKAVESSWPGTSPRATRHFVMQRLVRRLLAVCIKLKHIE